MPADWDKPLAEIKVPDLATGRAWVKQIEQDMQIVLNAARMASAEIHQGLVDRHYDLGQIRRIVQRQMGKFVKAVR